MKLHELQALRATSALPHPSTPQDGEVGGKKPLVWLAVGDEEVSDAYEDDLVEALSLLEDAKRLLGFLGDIALSPRVTMMDRVEMSHLADTIADFLDTITADQSEGGV